MASDLPWFVTRDDDGDFDLHGPEAIISLPGMRGHEAQWIADRFNELERLRAGFDVAYPDLRDERDRLREELFIRSRLKMLGRIGGYTDEEVASDFAPWWERRETDGLSAREVKLLETIAERNAMLADRRLACAFCGERYEDGTVEGREGRLSHHVMHECPSHPVRAALVESESAAASLRAALVACRLELRCCVEQLGGAREGGSVDRALSAADQVLGESAEPESIEDGFGGCWQKCERADCGLHVVRPGKVQCDCDTDDLRYIGETEAGVSGWLGLDDLADVVRKQAEEIRRLRSEAGGAS